MNDADPSSAAGDRRWFTRYTAKHLIDTACWVLAGAAAFWLRLDDQWPQYLIPMAVYGSATLPVKATLVYAAGLHRQSWQKVGVRDLVRLSAAVGSGTGILFLANLFFFPLSHVPRSIPLIDGLAAVLVLGGLRLITRMTDEYRRGKGSVADPRRVLVVGAGDAGSMMVREMLRHPEAGLVPVGFLDDKPSRQRQRLLGMQVQGKIADMARVARRVQADEVLIAIPSAPGRVIRRVVELAQAAALPHRIIPGVYDIISGKVSISQIREVDLEDLLRREPVRLDLEGIAGYLTERRVMVTGAGGSIGSEIVRQIQRFDPGRILMVGRGENSLYEIGREVSGRWPGARSSVAIADVSNRARMERLFKQFRPQVVFHAAAYKHVPLMESHPEEAVLNNVLGTKSVVELSLETEVAHFVNVSTDKAVHPLSVMGASKRVAELVVQSAAQHAGNGQVFVSVRFGNVLGSRGSVVPLFKEQILKGGPITITDSQMQRYFMTIPEASQLVLQAGGIGVNGVIYFLDMGEPVRIVDLAHDLIRLSGLIPGVDIDIVYTGPRPGEKIREHIYAEEDELQATQHEKILAVPSSLPFGTEEEAALSDLLIAAASGDPAEVRRQLAVLMPGFPVQQPRSDPVHG